LGGRPRRAIRLVEDARSLNGDLTENRLESEGPRPLPLNASIVFAMPLLQDQFVVGLLDQDLEEPALEFETRLMNVGLDLVGEMLVLVRHGQGHSQGQIERECLADPVDGADRDGSLKSVGVAHGVSPYLTYGDPSCVRFSSLASGRSRPQSGIPRDRLTQISYFSSCRAPAHER
jgi:hypothetical protein